VHLWFDDASGDLVGALPLYRHEVRVGVCPIAASVLSLVGDGSEDSDYLDLIAATGYEDRVVADALDVLGASADWDMLRLRTLPVGSHLANALTQASQVALARSVVRVESRRGGIVPLPPTFEAFLAGRQARFRTKLRSLVNRCDESFAFEHEPVNLDERLESLFDLHGRRWQSAGQSGVFVDPRKRIFYRAFVPRFAERGWLRLFSLRHEGRYVAHELCFSLDGRTTMLLQEGFDPDSGRDSYGQMLRALVFRHLIAGGCQAYDFLGGLTRHKEYWGAEPSEMVDVVVARKNIAGLSNFYEPTVRESVARGIRRVSPDAARRVGAVYARMTSRGATSIGVPRDAE
jgi:CelD/BcsL family acetyltransferase involved in cellulose biosynthesis